MKICKTTSSTSINISLIYGDDVEVRNDSDKTIQVSGPGYLLDLKPQQVKKMPFIGDGHYPQLKVLD